MKGCCEGFGGVIFGSRGGTDECRARMLMLTICGRGYINQSIFGWGLSMAIQQISSNFTAASSEHLNQSGKANQDNAPRQVRQEAIDQNTDQLYKTDITSRVEHVYDNKGRLLLKFEDSNGNVVFQSPSETSIKLESQKISASE